MADTSFTKAMLRKSLSYIIVENMIQSYCQRVNGNGRHKFYIGYVEENIKLYYC